MQACIDLGSNSFRVLKFDCSTMEVLGEFEKVVGTAEGVATTGLISDEAIVRIITAINESQEKLKYNPSKTVALTTAAMRYAKNSSEVIKKIYNQTGVMFKIISGDEEARLTLLAIEYGLKREKITSSKFIAADIGGGSTEIIIKENDNVISKSFEFGIVTLANCSESLDDARDILAKKIEPLLEFLENKDLSNHIFVATAGTPTTIAALKLGMNYFNYDKHKINGTEVTIEDIDHQFNKIDNLNDDEVYEVLGARKKKFVEVGIVIFKKLYEILGKNSSIVIDDGLREGIMIDYCLRQ